MATKWLPDIVWSKVAKRVKRKFVKMIILVKSSQFQYQNRGVFKTKSKIYNVALLLK